jgi:hypothetical protein
MCSTRLLFDSHKTVVPVLVEPICYETVYTYRQCYDLCEARAFALTSTPRPPCAILWQESVVSHHVDVVLCRFVDKVVTAIQKTLAITIDVIVFIHFVHCVWVV